MMSAVAVRPPANCALNGAGSCDGEKVLERQRCLVRAVRPKAVISWKRANDENENKRIVRRNGRMECVRCVRDNSKKRKQS